jgi:hypothetical protein
MSSPRSVRFEDAVLARLDAYVRSHPHVSVSSVVNSLVDEALRLAEHPGVVFRDGPTGRRAALADGPDVWEVVSALRDVTAEDAAGPTGEALVSELVEVTGLSARQVRAAARYYAAYPDEVDVRIAANRAAAEREEQLWRAERTVLRHSA